MTAAVADPSKRWQQYWRLISALARSRSVEDVALKLLPVLAKLGLALPSALLVWGSVTPMTAGPARHRVLVIRKAVFNEDVLQVLDGASDVQAFGVGRAVIKALALGLLPREICDDATYVSADPRAEAAKRRYRRLCRGVWRYLAWLGRYDAVLSGNWCYWAERELAGAMEEVGAPFIVLHKEGIKPPARALMLRGLFRAARGRFTGRSVYVYHPDERDHQVESQTARADQVQIVGMPRLDRVHAWRRRAAAGEVAPRAERPLVLVLAFMANNFLPSYSGVDSDLAWNELCAGTYQAAVRLARANPGIDVVVRPREHEMGDVLRLMAPEGPLPSNLRIGAEGEVMPLLEASWVVCGHNTTVLLEALAAGKPVVVPDFGEMQDPRYHGYNVELGDAVEHAATVDDLAERLARHCREPAPIEAELTPAAQDALAKWTGNPDGAASERVRRLLRQELSRAA